MGKAVREEICRVELRNSNSSSSVLVEIPKDLIQRLQQSPQIPGTSLPDGIGYIDSDRVIRYVTSQGLVFEGSPKLGVYIHFREDWERLGPGTYRFFRDLSPEEISQRRKDWESRPRKEEGILRGQLLESDVLEKRIDPQYVEQDDSGLIIPVTRKIVADELRNQRKRLFNGIYSGWNYGRAEKLARVAGVDISETIERGKRIQRREYLRGYSTEEHLERVIHQLERQTGCGGDKFNEFLGVVESITFPNAGLKKRAISLLDAEARSYQREANQRGEEIEEFKKEKEALIAELEMGRLRCIETADRLSRRK